MTEYEYTEPGWYFSRSPKYWFDNGHNQGYERGHDHGLTAANAQMTQLNNRISQLESENEELRYGHQKTDVEEKRKSFNDGFQEGKRRVQDQKQASFNEGYREAKAYWQQLCDETREYWKAKERDARENAQESTQMDWKQTVDAVKRDRDTWKELSWANHDKLQDSERECEELQEEKEKAWSEVFRERNKREEDRTWFWNKINELETELARIHESGRKVNAAYEIFDEVESSISFQLERMREILRND